MDGVDLTVRRGERVALLITAETTFRASSRSAKQAALRAGREQVQIDTILVEGAFDALNKKQDKALHDRLIVEAAEKAALTHDVIALAQVSMVDAAAQLKAGRIDAMFITAGAPSAVVTALAEDCGIRLLCVDGAAAKRLQDSCSSYSVCTIPAGTYPGQEEEVQTVGVKAVLLASAALPEKQVEQLTKLLFDGRESLSAQLGIRLDTEAEATEGVGIPFHKGAAAYYKTAGITVAS